MDDGWMDAGAGHGHAVTRNPAAIKEMLLEWCKVQCAGYEVNGRGCFEV